MNGTLRAAATMLASVAANAWTPVVAGAIGGGPAFGVYWRAGCTVGSLCTLAGFPAGRNRRNLRIMAKRSLSGSALAAAAGHLDIPILALAVGLAGPEVAAVIAQSGAIAMMYALWKANPGRYEPPGKAGATLTLAAVTGAMLVMIGQTPDGWNPAADGETLAGGLLAAGAAAVSGLNGLSMRWGYDTAGKMNPERPPVMAAMTGCMAAASAGSGAATLTLTAAFRQLGALSWQAGLLTAGLGEVIYTASGLTWRKANTMTRRLEINVIPCLAPALTIGYLAATGGVETERPLLLAAGAALTMAASVAATSARSTKATRFGNAGAR